MCAYEAAQGTHFPDVWMCVPVNQDEWGSKAPLGPEMKDC